jgi:hypothetical protein
MPPDVRYAQLCESLAPEAKRLEVLFSATDVVGLYAVAESGFRPMTFRL